MLRRTVIAGAWLIGTTVPLLMAIVFMFGCCVLPFHNVIHKMMPICDFAASLIRGEHPGHDSQQVPASEKQEPAKRIVTAAPRIFQLVASTHSERRVAASDAIAYRSFIAFGAVRCDRDVGLHLLASTLLI